ncbi:MAG: cobalamin biosynthesis protein [Clostridiales bacterium]|nr:cobalamin biosynthesis protein [Clostridiales bacterium]
MKKQVAVLFFTERGFVLAKKIRAALADKQSPAADEEPGICVTLYGKGSMSWKSDVFAVPGEKVSVVEYSLRDWCADVFAQSSALIFVGAAGIAVRTIAPFLVSKAEDPAVLVADEQGKHVISLLSGHLGGGNELTLFLAEALGADPVITTASDVGGKLAIDVWAKENHLFITDLKAAKTAAARIVGGMSVPFYCEGRVTGEIPPELVRVESVEENCAAGEIPPELVRVESVTGKSELRMVSPMQSSLPIATDCLVAVSVSESLQTDTFLRFNRDRVILHLVPRAVVLGIGCKKGKSPDEIRGFVYQILREHQVAPRSICAVASVDIKAGESGLIGLAEEFDVPFRTFSAQELQAVRGTYTASSFVNSVVGVDNVCERAAMAALTGEEQKKAHFLCRKTVGNGVTVALLEKEWEVSF